VRDKLIALLEPVVEGLGYELVELEHRPAGRDSVLRLYIDRLPGTPPAGEPGEDDGIVLEQGGIGLDDCEKVSRQVSAVLDVEDPIDGQYALEVSSPGFDRPLRKAAHYARFAGRRAKLELAAPRDGRRRYTGTLRGMAEDGTVAIEVDGVDFKLPLAAIERARLAE
jgi:ribosome maturation factor RimP